MPLLILRRRSVTLETSGFFGRVCDFAALGQFSGAPNDVHGAVGPSEDWLNLVPRGGMNMCTHAGDFSPDL